jgi:hypothetical protein
MSAEIHGDSASVHWQKFNRRTIASFEGIPRASVTCSRRYFRPGRSASCSDGFDLSQQASSRNGSSSGSRSQMKAKKPSSTSSPEQTRVPYW